MKNLVKLVSIAVFLTAINVSSQATPEPPASPKTTSVTIENSSSSYSSISDNHKGSSSSISVKGTNSSYKFRAYFDNDVTDRVRAFLQQEFKGKQFTSANNSSFWSINKNDEKMFECKVKKGSVRMYLNKELSSKKFQNEIKELGKRLKYVVNGSSNSEVQKAQKASAKRRLERAKREYEKAKRNFEKQQ